MLSTLKGGTPGECSQPLSASTYTASGFRNYQADDITSQVEEGRRLHSGLSAGLQYSRHHSLLLLPCLPLRTLPFSLFVHIKVA